MKDNNSPFIFIMMSTYNRPELAVRAVKSILQQEYQNYKLKIFNDGSTEDYSELESIIFGNPKIEYITSNNVGLNRAKNIMLDSFELDENVGNAYLCVLDDDDYFKEDAFLVFINNVNIYNDSWFCFNVEKKDSLVNNEVKQYQDIKNISYREFREDFHGDTHILLKSSIVSNLRYPKFFFKNGFEHIYYFQIKSDIKIIPQTVKIIEYQVDGLSDTGMYKEMGSINMICKHILIDPVRPDYYIWLGKELMRYFKPKNIIKRIISEERYYRIKCFFGFKK